MIERPLCDAPQVNFDAMPELAGYTGEPDNMYVGCPGKHGYLEMGFELNDEGRSILRTLKRRVPLIVQQELYFDAEMPGMPCVYILSSGAANVDGDRYAIDIALKKGAMAFISSGAATKLAEMKNNYSGMKQTITLEENAYLEYLPEPVIPCRHSRYISDTKIVIDASAAMFYSEIYMPGRKYYREGELFAYDVLSVCAHAQRPDGEQLFREKFVIEPVRGYVRSLGVMDFYDVFANVIVLAPKEKADEIYERTEAFIDRQKRLAQGITRLPGNAGLLFRALGMEPGPVKKTVRAFCSTVRETIKGHPLPKEFSWR